MMKNKTNLVVSSILAFAVILVLGSIAVGGGVDVKNPFKSFFGGVTDFDELQLGEGLVEGSALLDILVATTSASFRNLTGGDIFVYYVGFDSTGTASSTFELNVGTSTIDGIDPTKGPGGVNNVTDGILDRFLISTGTPPFFTDNYGHSPLINSGSTTVRVKNLEYVVASIASTTNYDNVSPCPRNAASVTGSCESATSTNRGFNINGYLKYFRR